MEQVADLLINGLDAYQNYGVRMGDGFISSLKTGAPLKDYVKNDSRLKHGVDYSSTAPKLNERNLTLQFTIEGENAADYDAKYDSLVLKGSLLEKGDTYVFVLTNLRNGSEAVPNVKSLGLTVVIDRHDAAPGIPGNYTEITKMDKREFKHFTEDITDGLQELWDEYFE